MDSIELTQEKIDSLISLYSDGKIIEAIEAIGFELKRYNDREEGK